MSPWVVEKADYRHADQQGERDKADVGHWSCRNLLHSVASEAHPRMGLLREMTSEKAEEAERNEQRRPAGSMAPVAKRRSAGPPIEIAPSHFVGSLK